MSGAPHIAWAFKQRNLTIPQRLVLLAIAERANGERVCFPSVDCLVKDCEMSRRAVFAAIHYLSQERSPPLIRKVEDREERGRILERAGSHPSTRSNVYEVLRPLADEEKARHQPTMDAHSAPLQPTMDAHSAPRRVQEVHSDGAPGAPEPLIESLSKKERPPPAAERSERPDPRKQLWSEGRELLRHLTGHVNGKAAKALGLLVKDAEGDCTIVLGALRSAEQNRPLGPPMGYLRQIIQNQLSARDEPSRVSGAL